VTMPEGRLWVNPEGVTAVGDSYLGHSALYEKHVRRVQSLRARYADAWGDDEMGREFAKKFLAGLDDLEDLLGGVRGTLDYTASSLRLAGKSYRDADDSALELAHGLAASTADTPATPAGRITTDPSTADTPAIPAKRVATDPSA